MFRSGLEKVCPALKLSCAPHVGHFNDGQDYKLARTLAAVRFMKEPHGKIPSEGFDLLMRRDGVQDVEVYLAMYDMQDLRDWLHKNHLPYTVNLLFHAWLFQQLPYRKEADAEIEAAIFSSSGVFPVSEEGGVVKGLRKFLQQVWVKDKIYMCMGPDNVKLRIDRQRLICSFWSLCIPVGEERAIATKHVLINETHTHISREVGVACVELAEVSVNTVLAHLQKLLQSVQHATHRLSRLMGRCEGAFDGVFLDARGDGTDASAPAYRGATDPLEVWEEQLALLDRSVGEFHKPSERPAPLLSEMIRRRVYENLGKRRRSGKISPDDEETIDAGARVFLTGCSGSERAQAVHRVLIECISDLEALAESNAEMLSVEGVNI
eukprot:TRINITY_DN9083_c0_g1_i1.p1 TRINITY_DN9083_c0_g1~~TRINITY_DN9083_c0_g1_i1.p1  ORF type:complete len:379 (-),score=79.39 TRINITY_DN9083_c0_g1_i1:288-1424(-)